MANYKLLAWHKPYLEIGNGKTSSLEKCEKFTYESNYIEIG